MAEVDLSEAERTYILHGVQDDLRGDGRSCEDYRYMEVETEVVSNTNGSARLRLSNTDILVGIKVTKYFVPPKAVKKRQPQPNWSDTFETLSVHFSAKKFGVL